MSRRHRVIVDCARQAYADHWSDQGDVGEQTRKSSAVCINWQESVCKLLGGVTTECRVADDVHQRIDLIDVQEGVAYELKSSSNNPHHEFYKDIFKVLIYNETAHAATTVRLDHFIFLAPSTAADKLGQSSFSLAARSISKDLGVAVELVAID